MKQSNQSFHFAIYSEGMSYKESTTQQWSHQIIYPSEADKRNQTKEKLPHKTKEGQKCRWNSE